MVLHVNVRTVSHEGLGDLGVALPRRDVQRCALVAVPGLKVRAVLQEHLGGGGGGGGCPTLALARLDRC